MTFQGPGGQRVGPPCFRCPGTLFPAKQTRQCSFFLGGELYYQHPAFCLYPIQSSMGTHVCPGSRDLIAAQVRELGGNKWSFLFLLFGGFPGGSDGKASACNVGDLGSIPGLGRSPGEGNGKPLQYSCLENSMD